jgi:GTP-binding protein HflX
MRVAHDFEFYFFTSAGDPPRRLFFTGFIVRRPFTNYGNPMIEIQRPNSAERIVLVGLLTSAMDKNLFEEDMQEMVMLCKTAGVVIVNTFIQKMPRPRASTFIGDGKLLEIHAYMSENRCTAMIIDAELSPGQVRTIEKIIQGKVIDRSQLILDIFAKRARTNEARIQVELAQLRTLYPRLTHAWSHFSQQTGGIGTVGPGEKQLEVDKRLVQKKILDLGKRLEKIESSRQTQRKRRMDSINLALVGYTNVGKSSILNVLCGSKVLVENKLFATLDTATRKAYIPEVGEVVVSDTVGFLRKLPHHLVASFKSTLEVVRTADILCIVMDASSDWTKQQYATVNEVLESLGVDNNYRFIIFNKIDLVDNPFTKKSIELAYPDSVQVCALNPEDGVVLKTKIAQMVLELKRDWAKIDLERQKAKPTHRLPDELL